MLFLLHESASGLGLLEVIEADDVASGVEEAMLAQADFSRFARMVRLKAFAPFSSAEHALENANAVSEGVITDYLREFVEANLPKPAGKSGSSKKTKTAADVDGAVELGVHDQKTAQALHDAVGASTGVAINADARSAELLRGVRCHFERLIDGLKAGDLAKAQLGLAHSYSRSKVKFNVNRSETGILNSIALLDTLDKDINTFAMRVREWYSWHFPELVKIAPDNIQYARLVRVVRNKADLSEESLPAITAVVMDTAVAQDILDAARSSMGTDISEVDLVNIEGFSRRVVELAEYRTSLQAYLASKMSAVAPNLGCLLGDTVAARLISHAGSLTNLAKYPASTVQILGAEKALFRALKTKGKTPKYGLLYVRVSRRSPRAPQACCALLPFPPGLCPWWLSGIRRCFCIFLDSGAHTSDMWSFVLCILCPLFLVWPHFFPFPFPPLRSIAPLSGGQSSRTRAASAGTWPTSAPSPPASTAFRTMPPTCLGGCCGTRWTSGSSFTTRARRRARTWT